MEKNVQQRAVDLDVSVVLDVSGFAEAVHEEVHAGAGAADDGGEGFLADLWDVGLGFGVFAEVCHVEQSAGEAFLGGVEELIDEVVLDAAGALEEIGDEEFGHTPLVVEDADHLGSGDAQKDAVGEGGGGGDVELMAGREALLADEVSGVEDRDRYLLAYLGDYGESCLALMNVKDAGSGVALREDAGALAKTDDGFTEAGLVEEDRSVERNDRNGFACHCLPFCSYGQFTLQLFTAKHARTYL